MTGHDELEQALAVRLARRAPRPPAGLLDELLRAVEAMPQRRARPRFASINRLALAAAGALMVVAIIAALSMRGGLRPIDGTGAQTAEPTPTPAILNITLSVPIREKAIAEQAEQVFADRLRSLGIGTFSASIGDDIRFEFVPPPGVSRSDIDLVLHTRGDIEWLAWPTDRQPPDEGDPIPNDVHPLFEAAGQVTAVEVRAASGGQPAGVVITLAPRAAEAVATYTAGHVNEVMPLAMDGRILFAPIIAGPIESGQIFISTTADEGVSPQALAALLMSGPLPEDWTMDAGGSQPPPSP